MQLCASEKEDKSNEVSAGENVQRLFEWEKFKRDVSEEASKSERIKVRKKEREEMQKRQFVSTDLRKEDFFLKKKGKGK
jgi:hypothetical protein